MDAIRISGLRSLADTGPIPIKPITILVGTNSSGKSTFLRAFPLLKQSIETATESPILWFGQYVDFGTIDTAINRDSPNGTIDFEFTFTTPVPNRTSDRISPAIFGTHEPVEINVKLKLTPSKQQRSRIGACELRFLQQKATLEFNEDAVVTKFIINEQPINADQGEFKLTSAAYLVPSIMPAHIGNSRDSQKTIFQPYQASSHRRLSVMGMGFKRDILMDAIADIAGILFHGNTTKETIKETFNQIRLSDPHTIVRRLKGARDSASWAPRIDNLPPTTLQSIINLMYANAVASILELADERVAQFAFGVSYMGPARAIAARYYRAQDLSVREVDFRGENLAMFLRSLSRSELDSFTQFTKEYFGIDVSGRDTGGHVEVTVAQGTAPTRTNLTDTGFGYSQMVPVIAQIWSTQRKQKNKPPTSPLVTIEQPELHLHPAHQAKLADLFAGTINNTADTERPTKFIIETHSEAIINRLGELITKGRLKPEDVQIAVFDQRHPNKTTISIANYNSMGELENWPFGFFSPPLD